MWTCASRSRVGFAVAVVLLFAADGSVSPASAQQRNESFEGRIGLGRPVGSFGSVQSAGFSIGAGGTLHATERLSLRADADFTALTELIDRSDPIPMQHVGQQLWQYMGGLGYRLTPRSSAYLVDTYVGAGLAHRVLYNEGTNALNLAAGMRVGRVVSRHAEIVLRNVVHRIGPTGESPRVVHQLQLAATWRN